MLEPIIYVDVSNVREGKLDELRAAIEELATFVDVNEPRIVAYRAYVNKTGTQMTVLHIHPDSASLEFHMKVAGRMFPKFKDLVVLSRIDVYGTLSDQLRKQLEDKAALLGGEIVTLHELLAGFVRLSVVD